MGTKLHKAFMAEIGEEMCQAEVAHHANKCPEYFCSRPVKHVHIYKKALGISKGRQEDLENVEDMPWSSEGEGECEGRGDEYVAGTKGSARRKRVTKMSDVELYEKRAKYWFAWGSAISPHLPHADTPEQQVSKASLFDFFRLVRFHGGKDPYLEWHDVDALPITSMSPVLKLVEGPSFAFGARWALMQYHVWYDRSDFMEASDDEVKLRFRQWMDDPACPWYIREEYVAANRRIRRARRRHGKAEPKEADPLLDTQNPSEFDGAGEEATEIESSSDEEAKMTHADSDADTHVLKML